MSVTTDGMSEEAKFKIKDTTVLLNQDEHSKSQVTRISVTVNACDE